ncbi:histidine phosphatase family protein [Shewanella sp. NIFS-20-20]|uniref:SixA phosphatase family protein n=1 Tax=Shewanella sp. NIFS-20-20 TaxID=2853806 RepID=UPI001C485DFC|nr:phosphoglycerate mutase family protein [Shewanella sp. NIFS-20-20]MBV7316137.1 histidine phosphatase family protein [Shewanella sp. NIFS-20-20]
MHANAKMIHLSWLLILALMVMAPMARAGDIVLLRHSEKLQGPDPALSPLGQARAERIASRLAPLQPIAVYSTDYQRTLQTAAPLAERLGVAVTVYDPTQLASFAHSLQQSTGTVVVVGHSNTTPVLLKQLTGWERHLDEDEFSDIFWLQQQPQGYRLVELTSDE